MYGIRVISQTPSLSLYAADGIEIVEVTAVPVINLSASALRCVLEIQWLLVFKYSHTSHVCWGARDMAGQSRGTIE